jgi:hypothetical protein
MFYTVGCVASYYYDATHLSALDRFVWVLYLVSMIWPAFAVGSNLGVVTPVIAEAAIAGMTAVIVSFAVHRWQAN